MTAPPMTDAQLADRQSRDLTSERAEHAAAMDALRAEHADELRSLAERCSAATDSLLADHAAELAAVVQRDGNVVVRLMKEKGAVEAALTETERKLLAASAQVEVLSRLLGPKATAHALSSSEATTSGLKEDELVALKSGDIEACEREMAELLAANEPAPAGAVSR